MDGEGKEDSPWGYITNINSGPAEESVRSNKLKNISEQSPSLSTSILRQRLWKRYPILENMLF